MVDGIRRCHWMRWLLELWNVFDDHRDHRHHRTVGPISLHLSDGRLSVTRLTADSNFHVERIE